MAAALIFLFCLLRSKKSSSVYRRLLSEETERLDVLETLAQSHPAGKNAAETELLREQAAKTEILPDGSALSRSSTAVLFQTGELQRAVFDSNLDVSPLSGKYELLREIHGGGMSRVFLARSVKLGSEWIVKFVERAELADEAEVLKKLNHISLPPIIDIFQTAQGTFLVERYIEGYSLSEVLALGQEIRESQICDWGLQLAQVLHYLHTLPTPIIHCDLKPSNIMVTHDNRLVLIDFGISKRVGLGAGASGLTYRYAAPEQFRGRRAARKFSRNTSASCRRGMSAGPLTPERISTAWGPSFGSWPAGRASLPSFPKSSGSAWKSGRKNGSSPPGS